MKAAKLAMEDKKSVQKSLEAPLKKSLETVKKAKREKRDGSTDSEDSDGEGKTNVSFNFYQTMCSTRQNAFYLSRV